MPEQSPPRKTDLLMEYKLARHYLETAISNMEEYIRNTWVCKIHQKYQAPETPK
jgi:hypothetical protein